MKKIPSEKGAFPADHSDLPRTKYGLANSFEAELIPIPGPALRGSFVAKTTDGRMRTYLFEAQLSNSKIRKLIVSLADPKYKTSFVVRAPLSAPITGLPPGARRDLKERAARIATYVLDDYEDHQAFLLQQFEASSQNEPIPTDHLAWKRTIRRAGDWLITRNDIEIRVWYSARHQPKS